MDRWTTSKVCETNDISYSGCHNPFAVQNQEPPGLSMTCAVPVAPPSTNSRVQTPDPSCTLPSKKIREAHAEILSKRGRRALYHVRKPWTSKIPIPWGQSFVACARLQYNMWSRLGTRCRSCVMGRELDHGDVLSSLRVICATLPKFMGLLNSVRSTT